LIDIRGAKDAIELARMAIEYSIKTVNCTLTHFISIPLNLDDDLTKTLEIFQEKTLKLMTGSVDINKTLFVPTPKLHLTISVHKIHDNESLMNDLKGILKDSCQTIKPFDVSIRGLDIMKGDPRNCRVLSAKISASINIDEFASILLQKLVLHGLSDTLSVKWHCTLMNVKYCTLNKPFDAQPILKAFSNYKFGIVRIKSIHISKFNRRQSSDGYYDPACIINLGVEALVAE
jgi:hypothetical protein